MSEGVQLFFSIAAAILVMVISMIYMDNLFRERKEWVSKPVYFGFYIAVSAFFWLVKGPFDTWIFFLLSSLIQYLLYTFIYEAKMISKLFAAFSLLVFGMLSEVAAMGLLAMLQVLLHGEFDLAVISLYGEFLAKPIFFLFMLSCILIVKRDTHGANLKNYLCLLTVLLISIVVIIALVIDADGAVNISTSVGVAMLGILVINFIVYYLLNNIILANEIRQRQAHMETQFLFQEKKYEQTSLSFKSISGLIHDTNKHLLYLRECALQKDFEESVRYIDTALDRLSSSYKRINTGFLVIDALVSNAMNVAESNHIQFKTDIRIDKDQIHIERYDLSVALGNLLDNAVEACMKISLAEDRYIHVGIFTSDNALVINIVNSVLGGSFRKELSTDKQDKVRHGYGLGNVERIAEKYGGSFVAERGDSEFEATVVLLLM